ncbi:hypothetical protein HZS80_12030 [Halomonas glaciei]|uniref:Uncharacterized protein n=1 Tax=Vreelandella glaciei TaxID=186761 RepID=A0A7Z0LTR0_9GAMM|nr:hypothetical protein [Halomonas glaciei]NYS78426.1 hypothetical protein [Halomonas glaciei]
MIEEAIVHVGMHKTGSSSIQDTFSKIEMEEVEYLSLGSANHSGFLATVLSENPQNYHNHIRNGRSLAQVQALKEAYTKRLHEELESVDKPRILISAEYLSRPDGGSGELEYLHSILSQYCRRIRVIGYVRPPIGYMQSAFQQTLKGGANLSFNLNSVYPNYYKRFAKMDVVFGKENVELVAFGKDALHKGDAVQDFALRIGAAVQPKQIIRANESLSLEATALLYTFRRFGSKPIGYEGFSRDNNLLIEILAGIGNQKLVFGEAVVMPVLENYRKDLDWMSERLGRSIIDQLGESPHTISSEENLINVAYNNRMSIWHLLDKNESPTHNAIGIARLVNWLHILNTHDIANYKEPHNTLFSKTQLEEIVSVKGDGQVLLSLLADALKKKAQNQAAKSVRKAAKKASFLLRES